ncbi:MAG: NYN domain-containing protein [Chloroflexaceae bacterium]|nr:NYN domain-containing protein [Chloroflexaceae bacterium]
MLYEHRRPDVAVFIDFENVYVSVRDKLDENPNFETIMDRCHDLGRVIIARAYADWYRYPRITSALYANSIEPMYVPTYYYDKDVGRTGRAIKNSVDMNICIDAMKTLFMHQNVEKFVLVTGDRDFIPLVHSIRQQGKEVVIIGIGGAASTHLAQSADEFLFYEQLQGKPAPAALPKQRFEPEPPAPPAAAPHPLEPTPPAPKAPDIYDTLVAAVRLVRERGYVSTLGSIKLVMKELMGGDFKENRYKDMNGRAFTKFKDFVQDAERRGHVQIFTSGTVNEVFLPGEDPLKLSQFAGDLREEVPLAEAPEVELPVSNNGQAKGSSPASTAATAGPSSNRSRRRRRRKPSSERTGTSATTAGVTADAYDDNDDDSETDSPTALGIEELALLAGEAVVGFADLELPDLSEDDFSVLAPDADLADQSGTFETSQQLTADATALLEAVRADLANDTATTPPAATPTLADLIDEIDVPGVPQATTTDAPLAEPAETGAAEIIAATDTPPAEAPPATAEAELSFSDEEWQAFQNMMSAFGRPVSFTQILDGLRELRNQQVINRTNEQMRTFAKQAINGGMLDKIGRGRHTYYQLKVEEETDAVSEAEAAAPTNAEASAEAVGEAEAAAPTNADMPANAEAEAGAEMAGDAAMSAEAAVPASVESDASAPAEVAETPEEYPTAV